MATYRLRSTSKKGAAQLAKYALVEPKISSLKTKERARKRFFGTYTITAKKLKLDKKRRPLKGTHFVLRIRKNRRKK